VAADRALAANADDTASAASATAAKRIKTRRRFCRDGIVPQGSAPSPAAASLLRACPVSSPAVRHVRSSGRGSGIAIRLRKSRQSQSWLPVLSKTSALGSRRVESAAS
jgi:hypothetical protein